MHESLIIWYSGSQSFSQTHHKELLICLLHPKWQKLSFFNLTTNAIFGWKIEAQYHITSNKLVIFLDIIIPFGVSQVENLCQKTHFGKNGEHNQPYAEAFFIIITFLIFKLCSYQYSPKLFHSFSTFGILSFWTLFNPFQHIL